jgi:glycosyltransferase involved in cell wall biosynthesis
MPDGLSPLRQIFYRASLNRARTARFIFTSSEFSRSEIVSLMRMDPSRVRAIRLGSPPLPAERGVERPHGVPEGPFALVVGDNRPRKNLRVLARAWARMDGGPALTLVAAGPSDPRYPSMERFAHEEGARNVVALGWISERQLAWLYAHAALVLVPTRYEGFGFPLVEAFQRGLPVVASDIPTLREIGEGVVEFVPADDADAWVRAVGVVSQPDRREALRAAGLARASELTYRHTAQATSALFHDVVQSAPA